MTTPKYNKGDTLNVKGFSALSDEIIAFARECYETSKGRHPTPEQSKAFVEKFGDHGFLRVSFDTEFVKLYHADNPPPPPPPEPIRVTYSTIDRFRQTRKFKTLAGARRYAQKWVGPHPDISAAFQYAVSFDGVGKVTVRGCNINDLFPQS